MTSTESKVTTQKTEESGKNKEAVKVLLRAWRKILSKIKRKLTRKRQNV